ncbi:hypothetical protein GCM10011349_45550 [Novosphingobium indicum]|uniref:Uncharacterized protein n=1 Tax=Novosphingobium indicum TaxID=462949 RepID=A0ABQ2JZN9_9SPHN|nr:hypothetical protein [Novosphingobium indicum]GGN62166.1 hypothetical protein GCM10011349_45550 [Novosphingobium indicum]
MDFIPFTNRYNTMVFVAALTAAAVAISSYFDVATLGFRHRGLPSSSAGVERASSGDVSSDPDATPAKSVMPQGYINQQEKDALPLISGDQSTSDAKRID